MPPNPSVKLSTNGRPPGPSHRYGVHFLWLGPGVLPLAPAGLGAVVATATGVALVAAGVVALWTGAGAGGAAGERTGAGAAVAATRWRIGVCMLK